MRRPLQDPVEPQHRQPGARREHDPEAAGLALRLGVPPAADAAQPSIGPRCGSPPVHPKPLVGPPWGARAPKHRVPTGECRAAFLRPPPTFAATRPAPADPVARPSAGSCGGLHRQRCCPKPRGDGRPHRAPGGIGVQTGLAAAPRPGPVPSARVRPRAPSLGPVALSSNVRPSWRLVGPGVRFGRQPMPPAKRPSPEDRPWPWAHLPRCAQAHGANGCPIDPPRRLPRGTSASA